MGAIIAPKTMFEMVTTINLPADQPKPNNSNNFQEISI